MNVVFRPYENKGNNCQRVNKNVLSLNKHKKKNEENQPVDIPQPRRSCIGGEVKYSFH